MLFTHSCGDGLHLYHLGVGNVFNPVPFQFTLNCEENGLIAVKLAVEIGKKIKAVKNGTH